MAMRKQNTSRIMMIEPVAFGYNPETAVNNYFQQQDDTHPGCIQQMALTEFRQMVATLRSHGIDVEVLQDQLAPHTPDSIFPNNPVSFHSRNRLVLYPMFAPNRRREYREEWLIMQGWGGRRHNQTTDYRDFAEKGWFLEGTGSMVLDRPNKIAYAALSPRTTYDMLIRFCTDFDYRPLVFSAFQQVGHERLPVYHTNVMMCVADRYAVLCTGCIDDREERERVCAVLQGFGKEVIEITEDQMHAFAGNMIQLENKEGRKLLVMSEAARQSLREDQISKLAGYNELISIAIPTIEKNGGGSVRCMIAEIF
jgi:hypothetical protein